MGSEVQEGRQQHIVAWTTSRVALVTDTLLLLPMPYEGYDSAL